MAEEELKLVMSVDPDREAIDKAVTEIAKRTGDALRVNPDLDAIFGVGGPPKPPGLPPGAAAAAGGGGGLSKLLGLLKPGGAEDVPKLLGGILGGEGGGGTLGQAGGIIGEALGGPVGAVIGETIAKAIPKAIAAPAKLVADSLGGISNSLHQLQGPLGPIGAGFDLITGSMKRVGDTIKSIPLVGEVLGPMIDQLTMIPGIIRQITETLVSFAAKASPGQFHMFQVALEDVQGVIGQAFLPVLELMRDGIRLFGDILASILPNMTEAREALAPLREAFAEFGKAMRDLMAELGPILRVMILAGLRMLATILASVAKVATIAAEALRLLLSPLTGLARLLGLGPEARTSVGAAARPAHIGGIEEYQKQLQLSAYAMPGESSIPQQQVNLLGKIHSTLEAILNATRNPLARAAFPGLSAVADLMGAARGMSLGAAK